MQKAVRKWWDGLTQWVVLNWEEDVRPSLCPQGPQLVLNNTCSAMKIRFMNKCWRWLMSPPMYPYWTRLKFLFFRWMPPLCAPASPDSSLCPFFCLQQVFSIFAFATIGGYTGTTHLTVSCPDRDQPVEAFFAYPFRYWRALALSQSSFWCSVLIGPVHTFTSLV